MPRSACTRSAAAPAARAARLAAQCMRRVRAARRAWQRNAHDASAAVQVLTFVLSPKNSDAAAMFAPGLALQSLLSLPTAARELAPKLLQLLVAKAVACDMEALRGQLLAVIARCAPPATPPPARPPMQYAPRSA